MDVASPIDARTAGRAAASGIVGTFSTPITARDSITLATPFARDWHDPGFVPFGGMAAFVARGADDMQRRPRAGYRSLHYPSATGEGRAS